MRMGRHISKAVGTHGESTRTAVKECRDVRSHSGGNCRTSNSPMMLFLESRETGLTGTASTDLKSMWSNIDARKGVIHFLRRFPD